MLSDGTYTVLRRYSRGVLRETYSVNEAFVKRVGRFRDIGYGYQWWIPENPEGDFLAIGIYGQFIYVHPGHEVVIAKTSAYVDYNDSGDEMEFESVEAFRAIARAL